MTAHSRSRADCLRSPPSPRRSSALVNVASALTPNIRWRGHLLLGFEPVEAMRLFHALALPAGAALLLVAPYLLKRRRRAWQVAIVLMLALGLFDLLKGLDFEETAITWGVRRRAAAAGGRVHRAPRPDHSALGALARAAARAGRLASPARRRLGVAGPSRRWPSVARETGDLLRWHGPIRFRTDPAAPHSAGSR